MPGPCRWSPRLGSTSSCAPIRARNSSSRTCGKVWLTAWWWLHARSWVTLDGRLATEKAKALVAAAVRRVALHEPLEKKQVPVNPDVLVVGAGIAGIQAALTMAESGKKVHLVERSPSIGGHMANFDKTFPTLDCSACILTPKMVTTSKHKNIHLMTYAEVVDVSGYVGNFKVKIRKKARYVDLDKCNGCGECWTNCPALTVPAQRVIRKGELIINEKAS